MLLQKAVPEIQIQKNWPQIYPTTFAARKKDNVLQVMPMKKMPMETLAYIWASDLKPPSTKKE